MASFASGGFLVAILLCTGRRSPRKRPHPASLPHRLRAMH